MYDLFWEKSFKELLSLDHGDSLTFICPKLDERFNYKLRLKGEVCVPFTDRTEDRFPQYYRKLEDSLCKTDDGYVLKFSSFNKQYERSAYCMVRGLKADTDYTLSYKYKAQNKKGEIILSLEFYYGKQKTRYYHEKADKELKFELKEQNDFIELSEKFKLEKDADFVMIKISGIDYDGEAQIYAPKILNGDANLVPTFSYSPNKIMQGDWIGEGFSLTQLPFFKVYVGDELVFEGRKGERLNRFAGVEFYIPQDKIKSKDCVRVEYGDNLGVTYPYTIKKIQLITCPKQFEVIGVSNFQTVNKTFGILVYSDGEYSVSLSGSGLTLEGDKKIKKGVNVVRLTPTELFKNRKFNLTANGITREFKISSFKDTSDGVLTGSGDFIYVNQNKQDFIEFLCWYLNGNVGNMITFRSAYRWGVTSELDDGFWEYVKNILNEIGMYYVLMCDGRELNGANANPKKSTLQSEKFLGEQVHEKDGSYIYWVHGISEYEAFFNQLFSRKLNRVGINTKTTPVYDKDGNPFWFITGNDYKDLKDAQTKLTKALKNTMSTGATRHTGVTPLFREFYKAGFDWLGYESMYGTHELMLGAIRAMSKSVGKKKFGTHLALQWSTTPCDDYSHIIRYRLSLYLSYMHGTTEINTEEGLWTMETPYADHDRFSYACSSHRLEQESFYKYIKSHDRTGEFKTDIAMICGKYDFMDCFTAKSILGQYGDEWKYNKPEQSWDMLKVFYPQADINSIYYFIVKGGEKNLKSDNKKFLDYASEAYRGIIDYKSVGFYSTTPYGPIDIISAEADNFKDYKFLFFTGWNSADEQLLTKLIEFVSNGGKLLLSKVHLYDSVSRKQVFDGKGKVINSELVNKLLASENVIYIDQDKYPIDIENYKDILSEYGKKFACPYILDPHFVSYSVYDDKDKTTIYLLDINWWTKQKSYFTFNFNGKKKKIVLPKNKMCSIEIDKSANSYKFICE